MDNKQERTVIHVEITGQHYYFGSLTAVYTMFTPEELGVALGTLRNFRVMSDKPYINGKCIIRKGTLITMPKKNL
ncbi:hypothetical protein [Bacteroides muris (ex Fokt et al. 2023)]|uniref:Uncharacterized protein n=1 Tax=Bacteroides muris (ex Fokt et al. 2023) TaxID=2937417 RepID=A0A9X2SRW1_9BACE|nr:hypothetical protein [Bacteroides muris (ex Fokt et al. 2023)]MCR6504284.1 hypothetical protein [Bacteroides muris (ex Fokt et al. 2023)]